DVASSLVALTLGSGAAALTFSALAGATLVVFGPRVGDGAPTGAGFDGATIFLALLAFSALASGVVAVATELLLCAILVEEQRASTSNALRSVLSPFSSLIGSFGAAAILGALGGAAGVVMGAVAGSVASPLSDAAARA